MKLTVCHNYAVSFVSKNLIQNKIMLFDFTEHFSCIFTSVPFFSLRKLGCGKIKEKQVMGPMVSRNFCWNYTIFRDKSLIWWTIPWIFFKLACHELMFSRRILSRICKKKLSSFSNFITIYTTTNSTIIISHFWNISKAFEKSFCLQIYYKSFSIELKRYLMNVKLVYRALWNESLSTLFN